MAGGKYIEVAMTDAVVDGNLVTGPAWPALSAWLAKFLTVIDTYLAGKSQPVGASSGASLGTAAVGMTNL